MLSTKTIVHALNEYLIDPIDVFTMDQYNGIHLTDAVYQLIDVFSYTDQIKTVSSFYSDRRKKMIVVVELQRNDYLHEIRTILSNSKMFNVILSNDKNKTITAIVK